MTNFWIVFGVLLFTYSVYLIWASLKVQSRQAENFARIDRIEYALVGLPSKYNCVLIQVDDTWTKANYADLRNKIIESPRFIFKYILPIHHLGILFSLKTIEKDNLVYVAMGSDTYDWNSAKARIKRKYYETGNTEDYS